MGFDLTYCLKNIIHILPGPKENVLGEPHSLFVTGPLRDGEVEPLISGFLS